MPRGGATQSVEMLIVLLCCGVACPTSSVPTCFRTLPAKNLEEIAAQVRAHSINALLIIGGFEVCPVLSGGWCQLH